MSLDGEVAGHVPGVFVLAGEALRVVTGPGFVDVDDEDDTPTVIVPQDCTAAD